MLTAAQVIFLRKPQHIRYIMTVKILRELFKILCAWFYINERTEDSKRMNENKVELNFSLILIIYVCKGARLYKISVK